MLQFEDVGWVARKRVDRSRRGPNNARQQRECAQSQITSAQDTMYVKRPFPWNLEIPQLTLQEETEKRVLRIKWEGRAPALASIHEQDRAMGVRLDSLLKAGTGICTPTKTTTAAH